MNGRTTNNNNNNYNYNCQRCSDTKGREQQKYIIKMPGRTQSTQSGCSIKLEWQKLITATERNEWKMQSLPATRYLWVYKYANRLCLSMRQHEISCFQFPWDVSIHSAGERFNFRDMSSQFEHNLISIFYFTPLLTHFHNNPWSSIKTTFLN